MSDELIIELITASLTALVFTVLTVLHFRYSTDGTSEFLTFLIPCFGICLFMMYAPRTSWNLLVVLIPILLLLLAQFVCALATFSAVTLVAAGVVYLIANDTYDIPKYYLQPIICILIPLCLHPYTSEYSNEEIGLHALIFMFFTGAGLFIHYLRYNEKMKK